MLYRKEGIYIQCASCKKLKLNNGEFVKLKDLSLLDFSQFIEKTRNEMCISHTLCPCCYEQERKILEKLKRKQ